MDPPLSGRGFVRLAGTPRPDKGVKGQNSKTLVTAGTIKRPLPCHVKGIKKQRIISRHKRKKNRVRREEKRLERKQREKERKLRKKGES